MKCPKCGSVNIELNYHIGSKLILCNDCGFDEREDMEEYPEEKTSQKEKGKYSPYKAGGRGRVKK